MQASLRPRKRPTVVGHHPNQGVVQLALLPQLVHNAADEMIKASDFIVVRRQVLPRRVIIGQKRRDHHLLRIMPRSVLNLIPFVIRIPSAVGIVRGEPAKERSIARPIAQRLHPACVTAVIVVAISVVDHVKGLRSWHFAVGMSRSLHMVLADQRGKVTGAAAIVRETKASARRSADATRPLVPYCADSVP